MTHRSIPLDQAWIRWGNAPSLRPSIKVIEVGQQIDRRYFLSWGRPNAEFRLAEQQQRVSLLFAKAMELTLYHGFEPHVVHRALLPIQEYRAYLLGNLAASKL
jgi:hypothetical protein